MVTTCSTGFSNPETKTLQHLSYSSFPVNFPAFIPLFIKGGPGGSSEVNILLSTGPYLISLNSNNTLTYTFNEFSWNGHADIIYLDQPNTVGFSSVSSESHMCHTRECYSRHFYLFLEALLHKHPEYKGRQTYLTGTSYAGHNIPAFSNFILSENTKTQNKVDLNLKGCMIGGVVEMGIWRGTLYCFSSIPFDGLLFCRRFV